MFNRSLQAAGLVLRIALLIALLAMPAVQVARNYSRCDLKGRSALRAGEADAGAAPQEAVIVSKLVYGLLDAYFSEVERAVPPTRYRSLDPEVVGRELARGAPARTCSRGKTA